MSEWRVTSNPIGDEIKYAVYRLLDVDAPDHSGNREIATGYMSDKTRAVELCAVMNDEAGLKTQTLINDEPASNFGAMAMLHAIEIRIRSRRDNVVREFYAIGDDLNEAKASGVVAHGEWEDWATEITGLNIRSVQRLMQAAREVTPEMRGVTSLGKLDFRQLSTVLTLPEGEREGVADAAVEQALSSREVEQLVAEAKAADKKVFDGILADVQKIHDEDMEAYERRLTDAEGRAKLYEAAAKKAAQNFEAANKAYGVQLAAVETLEAEIQTRAEKLAEEMADEAGKDSAWEESKQANAELTVLRDQLAAAHRIASEQARLRSDAQRDLLTLRSQQARGETPSEQQAGLTLAQFAEAAHAFVGRCAELPHMRAQLSHITKHERDGWESCIAMVQTLLTGGREALSCVAGEGDVIHE